ncbi:MAG: hypothetical protein RIS47_1677 [Bacteroidota bacterium]
MADKRIKIFVPGGRLATDSLSHLLETCRLAQVSHFQFGRRQEIILCLPEKQLPYLIQNLGEFDYDTGPHGSYAKHNVITSALAENLCSSNYWIRGGIFLDILDTINWTPSIRVNITDLKQDLVYSFTGDINLIPSDERNFWHIYLRNRIGGDLFYLPSVIHSDDIHRLVRSYEEIHKDTHISLEAKISHLEEVLADRLQAISIAPHIKVAEFFNYEGIHPYAEGKNWIGLYKRETRFSLQDLAAIVSLCRQHQIGHIYTTPWKTILIKEITDAQLTDWKLLLAQSDLNIGQSYAELNWQINDFDDEAQHLKAFLRRELVAHDISSNGVIIGINNNKNYSFSHVIIEKNTFPVRIGTEELASYTIYIRKDFNPTFNEFEVFRKWIVKSSLINILKQVFTLYYEKAYREYATFTAQPMNTGKQRQNADSPTDATIHQCPHCQTRYLSEIGDSSQEIPAGTPFAQLPYYYRCPICDTEKFEFVKVLNPQQ